MTQLGFRIISHDAPGWKPCRAKDILGPSYVSQESCPIHDEKLAVIASLVGDNDQLDIGACPRCGLVTYTRRPTRATIEHFYSTTWMGETADDAKRRAEKEKTVTAKEASYGPKDSSCLEIGVGYGGLVHILQSNGYKNVEGVELCPVRAKAVRDVFGIPVYEGDFLDFCPDHKYDLLFASEVIEHLPTPVEFVQHCASMQDTHGTILLGMPNFYAEPSVGVLLFWPHLYSHTQSSLVALLHCGGYVVEGLEIFTHLHVTARKAASADEIAANASACKVSQNHVEAAVAKLFVGLGLVPHGPQTLTWQRAIDGAAIHPHWHDEGVFERHDRRMVIERLTKLRTSAPLEIQFDSDITLFYK